PRWRATARPAARRSARRASRTASSMTTSRHQSEALDLDTPRASQISPNVQPAARSSRARSCSTTLPRYPTGPWWPGPVTATAAPPPLKGQTLGLRGVTALLAVEVVAELLAAVGVAELGQGLGLDLADAL